MAWEFARGELNRRLSGSVPVTDEYLRWPLPGALTASSQHGEETAVRGRGKVAMRPQFKILVIMGAMHPGSITVKDSLGGSATIPVTVNLKYS